MKKNCELVEFSDLHAEYIREVINSGAFDSVSDYIADLIKQDRGEYSDSPEEDANLVEFLKERSKGPFIEFEPEKFLKELQDEARQDYGES